MSSFSNWKNSLDEKYMKYNVCLYQLKAKYEINIKNPRLFPNQEFILKAKPNLIINYIYNYDEKEMKLLELDSTLSTHFRDIDDLKENIVSLIKTDGNVRVSFFTKRNDNNPYYYLLSTYDEDKKYYAECDKYMYDDIENMIYYMVRYDIDKKATYILSGMSNMDIDHMKKNNIIYPPCPYLDDSVNKDEFLKFCKEYFEDINLFDMFEDINKAENESENIYKELDKIYKKYSVSSHVFSYFKFMRDSE